MREVACDCARGAASRLGARIGASVLPVDALRRGGGPDGGSTTVPSSDPRLEPGLSEGSRLTRVRLPVVPCLLNPDEELAAVLDHSIILGYGATSVCSSSLAVRNM